MRGSRAAGVFLGILALLVLASALLPGAAPLPAAEPGLSNVGTALWEGRTAEVILQGLILLAGAAAVLLLLGIRAPREDAR